MPTMTSTHRNCNTIAKVVISCTILRKYLAVLDPLPVNLGIHTTRSDIIAPLIIINSPDNSSLPGYGNTTSKPIIILLICGGKILYLLLCFTNLYDKKYTEPLAMFTSSLMGDPIIAVSQYRAKSDQK